MYIYSPDSFTGHLPGTGVKNAAYLLLQDSIPEFLRYVRFEKRMSEHTYTAYENDLSQFAGFLLAQFDIEDAVSVKHIHIRSWLAGLKEEGQQERTLQRKASALKSFFKYLMRLGVCDTNPTRLVTAPKAPRRLPVFLEEGQSVLIEQAGLYPEGFEGETERLIMELLYQCGLRRAELIGLKETDVEFSRRQIRVLGKRNKERMIPVNDTLLTGIKQYMDEKRKNFNQPGPHLLCLMTGKPLYPNYVYRVVTRHLGGVTTLVKKSPHVLRHTFATQLSNNGAELNAVKELLGHSSLAATQIYTQTNINRLKEVYRKAHPKG